MNTHQTALAFDARAADVAPVEAPIPGLVPDPTPCAETYEVIRRAIEFVSTDWRRQPKVEEIADAAGVSAARLTRTFERWAGLTPKQFLQAVTLDHTRRMLAEEASVLDVTFEAGLSGPSRLHDLYVTHEAMPPGAVRRGGEGVTIDWGVHDSPFGPSVLMATPYGLAGIAFADLGAEAAAFDDMASRWPRATYRHDPSVTAPYAARVFDPARWRPDEPLRIVTIGTDFEVRVWSTLLSIPFGRTATYSHIARKIAAPKAARAVGAAVGRNPLSFVVPCHRVVGKCGALTGYHWGLTRKRAILGWEAAKSGGLEG